MKVYLIDTDYDEIAGVFNSIKEAEDHIAIYHLDCADHEYDIFVQNINK